MPTKMRYRGASPVFVLLFSALFFCLPTFLTAQGIKGQDDDVFVAAVDDWLAGEDLVALNSFAALARDGNRAAQILLANLASRSYFHSHVTGSMPRKERIALLRVPEGLSGKSWLTKAQDDEPIAAALLQATRVREKNAAAAALITLGEPIYGLGSIEYIDDQGDADAIVDALAAVEERVADDAHLAVLWMFYRNEGSAPSNLRYVRKAMFRNGMTFPVERLQIAELAYRPISKTDQFRDGKSFRSELVDLSDQVESWTPIRGFCEANCPQDSGACTVVGAWILGTSGLFPHRSPLENIIPARKYWTSDRILADIARNMPDLRNNYRRVFSPSLSACFMDSMVVLQSKHGYAK